VRAARPGRSAGADGRTCLVGRRAGRRAPREDRLLGRLTGASDASGRPTPENSLREARMTGPSNPGLGELAGPLAGVRVVALEQAVAGPLCTRHLADLGAQVTKVERPGGDFARQYDSVVLGMSAYFVWLNHGKRSVALDLSRP